MVRSLPWIGTPRQPQRRTTFVLMTLIALLTRWVVHLERAEARAARRVREFEVMRVDGRAVGAVYEDGRLVGVLEDVARL
jgi:hypothetical protein